MDDTRASHAGLPVDLGQFDVVEFVGDAFDGTGISGPALAALARQRGVHEALAGLLEGLPRTYRRLADVWQDVPDLPVEFDPSTYWQDQDPPADAAPGA